MFKYSNKSILAGVCYTFILSGSVQHIIGGALLLINPETSSVTWTSGPWFVFNAIFESMGGIVLGGVLIWVSLLCLLGMFYARKWADFLVLPQYIFYLVGVIGIGFHVYAGNYPDGYVPLLGIRPGLFILQDQLPSIIMSLGHTIAVLPLVLGLFFGIGPWKNGRLV